MIIRLFFFGLLFYVAYKVIRTVMDRNAPNPRSVFRKGVGEIDDVMIKDPYCQVYFPKREGVHLRENGKDLYFCSPDCRDKFLSAKQ